MTSRNGHCYEIVIRKNTGDEKVITIPHNTLILWAVKECLGRKYEHVEVYPKWKR